MEFTKVISERESVRNYDPRKEVPENVLQRVVEAGRLAPTAVNKQPFEILVIQSEQALQKVKTCYEKSWFQDAPMILAVKGDRSLAWERYDGYNSLETDATIAMDHMILAAENEGLGTCWVANFNNEKLEQILEMKESEQIFALTPLGYPKDGYTKSGNKLRKSLDELVTYL